MAISPERTGYYNSAFTSLRKTVNEVERNRITMESIETSFKTIQKCFTTYADCLRNTAKANRTLTKEIKSFYTRYRPFAEPTDKICNLFDSFSSNLETMDVKIAEFKKHFVTWFSNFELFKAKWKKYIPGKESYEELLTKTDSAKKKIFDSKKAIDPKSAEKVKQMDQKLNAQKESFNEISESLFALSEKTIYYAFSYVSPVVTEFSQLFVDKFSALGDKCKESSTIAKEMAQAEYDLVQSYRITPMDEDAEQFLSEFDKISKEISQHASNFNSMHSHLFSQNVNPFAKLKSEGSLK